MLKALRQRLVGNEAFIWLHFGEVDWTMHEHGPDTPETLACLDRVSKGVAEAFTLVEERCAAVPHALIFGDHGAVAVERTVDIAGTLGRLPLREGDDYVAFLDSTVARVSGFPTRRRASPVETALERVERRALAQTMMTWQGCARATRAGATGKPSGWLMRGR